MKQCDFKQKLQSFDICKWKYVFFSVPLLIIIVGIFLICFLGFNTSIDFTGGTVVSVVPVNGSGEIIDVSDQTNYKNCQDIINNVLQKNGLSSSLFQTSQTDDGLAIQCRYQDKSGLNDEQMNKLNDVVIADLKAAFNLPDDDTTHVQAAQRIGATATAELLKNALIAILVAVALILIYIAIRFELASGAAAIIALLSDVLVTCAFVLMFRIQVGSAFIAALITIVGYSINNTIIIFDRIREIRKTDNTGMSNYQIANSAVKSTLVRTMNTTITTLLAVVLLAIIGVAAVREFVIPIIIGLVAGTYSSIFVAPSLWALIYRPRKTAKKRKQTKKA